MSDRTNEFFKIIDEQKRILGKHEIKKNTQKISNSLSAAFLHDFHSAASDLSKEIFFVSQKLNRLTRMVQRNSLFDDKSNEMNELTVSIKEDISSLNLQLESVQQWLNENKTALTTNEQNNNNNNQNKNIFSTISSSISSLSKYKDKNNQLSQHSTNVMNQLQMQLMDTTKDFRDILKIRSSSMKKNDERKQMFGSNDNKIALTPSPLLQLQQRKRISNQNNNNNNNYNNNNNNFIHKKPPFQTNNNNQFHDNLNQSQRNFVNVDLEEGNNEYNENERLLGTTSRQESLQLIPQNDYYQNRANMMTTIESSIQELGSLFSRLSTLIAGQQDLIDRIEDNTDYSITQVNSAYETLQNVYANLSSNRSLTIKIFSILFVFIVFFIVFLL